MSTSSIPKKDLDRIKTCLAMLASDHDAEIALNARHIGRVLAGHKLKMIDLPEVLGGGASSDGDGDGWRWKYMAEITKTTEATIRRMAAEVNLTVEKQKNAELSRQLQAASRWSRGVKPAYPDLRAELQDLKGRHAKTYEAGKRMRDGWIKAKATIAELQASLEEAQKPRPAVIFPIRARECDHCHKQFTARTSAKTCSPLCRKRMSRARRAA